MTPSVSGSASIGRNALLVQADQRQRREHDHDTCAKLKMRDDL
jgi:hypothetical protein